MGRHLSVEGGGGSVRLEYEISAPSDSVEEIGMLANGRQLCTVFHGGPT